MDQCQILTASFNSEIRYIETEWRCKICFLVVSAQISTFYPVMSKNTEKGIQPRDAKQSGAAMALNDFCKETHEY